MSEQNLPSRKKISFWKIGLAVIIIVAIAYVQVARHTGGDAIEDRIGETEPGVAFAKKDMGEAWPFKGIESGVVYCFENKAVIFKANNGRTYALNGWGKTYSKSHGNLWNSSDEIQITGKDISPILSRGNELCK